MVRRRNKKFAEQPPGRDKTDDYLAQVRAAFTHSAIQPILIHVCIIN